MVAPVIYCSESVPQAAVPTASTCYEQQCVMHPAGDDQQLLYNMRTCCHSACATGKRGCCITDSAHIGCVQRAGRVGQQDGRAGCLHQDSRIQRRRIRQTREAFADASSYFDESEDKNVSVVLSNLPKMLWSEACFEVALDATPVKDAVRLFAVERTTECTEAVVILKTEAAAQTLMTHFRNMNCGRFGGITARYCEERGNKLLLSMTPTHQQQTTKVEGRAPIAEVLKLFPAPKQQAWKAKPASPRLRFSHRRV